MRIHELKIWSEYFDPVLVGQKTAELRNNDRNFKQGDIIHFKEYDLQLGDGNYTGRDCYCVIQHLVDRYPVPLGYVLISMTRCSKCHKTLSDGGGKLSSSVCPPSSSVQTPQLSTEELGKLLEIVDFELKWNEEDSSLGEHASEAFLRICEYIRTLQSENQTLITEHGIMKRGINRLIGASKNPQYIVDEGNSILSHITL